MSAKHLAITVTIFFTFAFAAACAESGETPAQPSAPGAFANATYHGVADGPVRLADGVWEGAPYAPGGASRPRVGLNRDFQLQGDLNGDGTDEFVVLVWTSSGGSGTFDYLAVMALLDGQAEHLASAPLGDRVRIRDARIEKGEVIIDVTQQGPGDAACCPTQQATRRWRLESGRLVEQ